MAFGSAGWLKDQVRGILKRNDASLTIVQRWGVVMRKANDNNATRSNFPC